MTSSANPSQFDILIIGSGAAGLTLALRTADFARVAVLSKGKLSQGATFYAQGGIAAVLDEAAAKLHLIEYAHLAKEQLELRAEEQDPLMRAVCDGAAVADGSLHD